jgi:hypothetical protein
MRKPVTAHSMDTKLYSNKEVRSACANRTSCSGSVFARFGMFDARYNLARGSNAGPYPIRLRLGTLSLAFGLCESNTGLTRPSETFLTIVCRQ